MVQLISGIIIPFVLNSNYSRAQTKPPIQTNEVEVVVLNYNQTDAVLKFEKIELGIVPPVEIMNKVNRFVKKETGEKINPYLEWELKIEAEFTHPTLESPILIDAFYFQPFESWMKKTLPMPKNRLGYNDNEYASVGGYRALHNDYPFRIRFSPPETGEWEYKIRIEVKGKTIESETFSFKVIESENKGYMAVGENKRFLAYDSKTFVPIGCNMPWPLTHKNFDPEFSAKNVASSNDYVIQEQSRSKFVAPRVQQAYRNVIDKMADNGANCFRMIMYPTATDIEWEELGNYTNRLQLAQEIDSILIKAEERDIFIQWVLQTHYSYQHSEHAYYTHWAWDSEIDGNKFCYSTIPGIDRIIDFFNNDIAKKYYKQRLRYILARWGYSTNISVFEVFSEISNVGTPEPDASAYYNNDDNWKLSRDWQWEMADYIKSKYQGSMHLLTASYAGSINSDDDVFKSNSFDVMGSNIYDFGTPSFSHNFWNTHVALHHLNETCESSTAYGFECVDGEPVQYTKPLIWGESGVLNVGGECDINAVENNRFLWQGLFSGLAGSFTWHSWYYPQHYGIFGKMNDFINRYELDGEKFHPGASKMKDYDSIRSWVYRKKYARRMDATFSPNVIISWRHRDRKADICYLRSGDKNKVIGVITNKTYNIGNTADCFEWEGFEGSPLEFQQKVDCKDEKLKLMGLKSGRYDIEYFLPSDLSIPIATSKDAGPKVKIEYSIDASAEGYIVLFVATKRKK